MLKGRLAAHLPLLLLCLLSSVESDEGLAGNDFGYEGGPFLVSTFKEICLERLDPITCQYWDSLRFKPTDSESPNYRAQEKEEGNLQEEIGFEPPVVEAENNFQKRFTVFRRKTSTGRGYKRGPGFRSWGGKRDFFSTGENLTKRNKFASWGGKRDGEVFPEDFITSEKKPKFQNWGGKKSTDDFPEDLDTFKDSMEKREPIWKDRSLYLSEPFKKHVPKRPQFQSWGGKRAPYPWHKFLGLFYTQPRYLLNGGEKRKFSSWGGKRFDESETQQDTSSSNKQENSKRHVFQNWGGKRFDGDSNQNKSEPENEKPTDRKKREIDLEDEKPETPSVGEPKEWKSRR